VWVEVQLPTEYRVANRVPSAESRVPSKTLKERPRSNFCLATRDSGLVHRRGCDEIDLLPFSLDDSGANLSGRFAFLMLLVGVVELLQASRALRSVGALKAAMQAVVAHAVAISVARLLVQDVGNLRGELVGVRLVRILRISSPQIGLGENPRQRRAFRRRPGIKGWDTRVIACENARRGPLGRHSRDRKKEGQGQGSVQNLVLKMACHR